MLLSSSLISILIGLLIVALMVTGLYFALRHYKSKKDATEFLDALGTKITKAIIDTINSSAPIEYSSLAEFEKAVLDSIYNQCWDFVETEAKAAFNDNVLVKAAFDLITKERVIKFIDDLVDTSALEAKFLEAHPKTTDEIEAEDKQLEEKFSNEDYIEEVSSEDMPVGEDEEDEIPQEELDKLNPPKDEEEGFDIEDDSMELVDEDAPTIITKKDVNGNTLYYKVENGKKVRIKKEDAMAILNTEA